MHLLLITNVFPNPIHEVRGPFNMEMSRALLKENWQVTVVSPVSWVEEWRGRRKGKRIGPERFRVLNGIPAYYPRYFYTPKILRAWYGTFMWHSVRRTLFRAVEAQRPDVILSYWAHPEGYVGLRLARRLGTPCIVVIGGSDVLQLCKNSTRRRCILNVLRAVDLVICVSGDLKRKVEQLGVDPAKVKICWRGVDTEKFCPGDRGEARRRLGLPSDERLLLCVAGLVPVKGHANLIDALAILRQRNEKVRLLLVGQGPLEQTLRRRCAEGGLQEAVRFVGPVRHDDLPDWYRAADLTVLSSLSEGIPNVLLESMATGIPFVASRVGGIPEIAAEGVDRLVPPGDPAALADAVQQRLASPDGKAPRVFVSWSWSASARQLMDVIESLVQQNDRTASYCRTRT